MGDVTIQAPLATVAATGRSQPPPSPEELCKLYYQEIQELKRQLRELGDTASMISSVALGMLRLLCDAGLASGANMVSIPRALHEQMVGASVTLGDDSHGNITVSLRERGRDRVEVA